MRTWLCAVVVLVGCGEGAGGDGAGAPACDIPPVECSDGAEPERSAGMAAGETVARCSDGEQWTTATSGARTYYAAPRCDGADVVWCWPGIAGSALRVDLGDCSEPQVTECWSEDGEPEDCDSVVPRFRG